MTKMMSSQEQDMFTSNHREDLKTGLLERRWLPEVKTKDFRNRESHSVGNSQEKRNESKGKEAIAGAEFGVSRGSYLSLHKEKQLRKDRGFFLFKKRVEPQTNLEELDNIYETPRFASNKGQIWTMEDTSPSETDPAGKYYLFPVSVLNQVKLLPLQYPIFGEPEKFDLTFAEKANQALPSGVRSGEKTNKESPSKVAKAPWMRKRLPSTLSTVHKTQSEGCQSFAISKSLDKRPKSDGHDSYIKKYFRVSNYPRQASPVPDVSQQITNSSEIRKIYGDKSFQAVKGPKVSQSNDFLNRKHHKAKDLSNGRQLELFKDQKVTKI